MLAKINELRSCLSYQFFANTSKMEKKFQGVCSRLIHIYILVHLNNSLFSAVHILWHLI